MIFSGMDKILLLTRDAIHGEVSTTRLAPRGTKGPAALGVN
jgi:hypothetical protein